MAGELERLKANKEGLLLAEVAAWLHDWRKCSDEHIRVQASPQALDAKPIPDTHLDGLLAEPGDVAVCSGSDKVPLKDLIISRPDNVKIIDTGIPWLVRALRRCHHAAHVEKELHEKDKRGKQHYADTRSSSPFGYEGAQPLIGLTGRLNTLPYGRIRFRSTFYLAVKRAFVHALGDTRRPVNEVTLWDWASSVAALYKAALAGCALTDPRSLPNVADFRWRLVSVRFDGRGFIERSPRISDMLARKHLLENGLDRVRTLLEETYPLGTEVYRDENGSLFVVPDMDQLLDCSDGTGVTLTRLIREQFAAGNVTADDRHRVDGELVPEVELDPQSWAGSWPPYYVQEYQLPEPTRLLPPVSDRVREVPCSPADTEAIWEWWLNSGDICPVCGLRPQGPKPKAKERKVCHTCEGRREDRSKGWAQNLTTTIWVDEVADVNGRIALVVGRFGIDEWLKPEGLVKTLFVTPPKNGQAGSPKNPSFARLRRVWETTHAFWRGVAGNLTDPNSVGSVSPRLRLLSTFASTRGDPLVPSHTYEILLDNVRLSLACVRDGELLTTENLLRLARVLEAPEEFRKDYCTAAMYLRDRLQGKSFSVEEPTGYGSPKKNFGTLTVTNVAPEATVYTPAIRLLEEPRTFMALVPADKALNVARAIKVKYETEMGKVRDRLPVAIGLVFAGARMPLPAILEAGRRMLSQPLAGEWWTLHTDAEPCGLNCHVTFTNGFTWRVPIKMGDRVTDDDWYPYFIASGAPRDQSKACPWRDGRWLVHVSCLKKGERVLISPSRFDFEFLDTAARRFEVSYGEKGRRRGQTQRNRPCYLEVLRDFDEIWALLAEGLTSTQIRQLEGLIEAKRGEWNAGEDQKAFQSFVHDVVANAEWKQGPPAQLGRIYDAAMTGLLSDILELHMKILKERPEHAAEEVKP